MWSLSTASIALLAFIGQLAASPVQTRSGHAVKDSHRVPDGWTNIGSAPRGHILNLNIGLKQAKVDELERHLFEVSEPSHERYGQHLSTEEVNELVAPSEDAERLVHEWLNGEGIDSSHLRYTPARDWIKVRLPVSKLEELLDTKYSVFEHDDGDRIVRAPVWSLPLHLHEHIDTIQPTNSFFRPEELGRTLKTLAPLNQISEISPEEFSDARKLTDNAPVSEACNTSAVSTNCLRTFYETKKYKPKVPGLNRVGLTDFLKEANNRSDVKIFLQNYRPDAVSAADTFAVEIINGGDNQQTPNTPEQLAAGKDLEGNLDAETILGIGYPTPLTAFSTGGMPPFKPDAYTPTDTNEPYLEFLQAILSKKKLPQVISSSYGDDEQTVPFAYAKRVCNQFMQLGAKGVSFLTASGDNGVGKTGYCVSNDGKNSSEFLPIFPGGCPYVTTIGATKEFNPEVAAFDPRNGFTSGGGFSNYFPRPGYQNEGKVVEKYVQGLKGQYDGLYNKKGRAYPDVSAQGQSYITIWNGTVRLLDGTSASTPTTAAILSLVNDALLASGKPVLGFLNPWLYKKGYQGFSDILSGSSSGCGGDGFVAAKGWDPVTGFGTPNFPRVSKLALQTIGKHS